jgi:hypothetical protein
VQNSIKRGRFLKSKFLEGTLTIEENEEYQKILEKRKIKNEREKNRASYDGKHLKKKKK